MAMLFNRNRTRLADDAGFILVEVMVSAAILVMVSLSVFAALDHGDRLAGGNQKRAIAANVAQAEIERVRSLPIEDVARLSGTRTITEGNTEYSLTSTTRWVTDNQDQPDCRSRSGGLDYMRLTAKVSWAKMGNAKPISISTIVTPSSRSSSSTMGSLSVYVRDAKNDGVSNLLITLDGTQDFSETTNVNGCVVFPFIPAGNYTLEFGRDGWVDGDSVQEISQSVSVAAGQTTKVQYTYDQGGTTNTRFFTGQPGPPPGAGTVPSSPVNFSLFNGDQTRGAKVITLNQTMSAWDGRTEGVKLFPSLDPYTMYAGMCGANSPPSPTNVNIPRGQHQPSAPVRLPAYDVVVYTGTASFPSSLASNAKVVVNAGCGADWVRTTNASGRLTDPGFPYSANATVCVQLSGQSRKIVRTVPINDFSDSPTDQPFYMGSGTTSGSC